MKFFRPFFEKLQKILKSSRTSVKNFALFALLVGLISLLFRTALVYFFSPIGLSEYTIKALIIIVLISSTLSVVIFYLRFHYSLRIKQLFSRFVNFEERDNNNLRWAHLEDEAKKQFPEINFNAKFLVIPLIF